MTIEQKSKAYDEALERAKKELQACGSTDCDAARQIFRLFPELKESEDEKVRKEIINIFHSLADGKIPVPINFADIFAWLEKQEGKHITEPQSRWRPSKEQMDALAWALSLAKNCGEECAFDLRTLQEQLKNL